MITSENPEPDHAYVPGMNARHPEGMFDAIRATARQDMPVGMLLRCDAFHIGIEYVAKGYYWEAHEVLEAVWLALPANSLERFGVQGIIQLANAHLKMRMKRPKAARRLCDIAENLLNKADEGDSQLPGVEGYLQQISNLRVMLTQDMQ